MKLAPPALPHHWTEEYQGDGAVCVRVGRKAGSAGVVLWTFACLTGAVLAGCSGMLFSGFLGFGVGLLLAVIWLVRLLWLLCAVESWRVGPSQLETSTSLAGFTRSRRRWSQGRIRVTSTADYQTDLVLTLTTADEAHVLAQTHYAEEAFGLATHLAHHTGWEIEYAAPNMALRRVVEGMVAVGDLDRMRLLLEDRGLLPLLVWEVTHVHERERLLELMRRTEARSPLIEPAIYDARPEVRAAAIELLVQLGDRRVLPVLRSALTGRDLALRQQAADAVGRLEDRESVPILCAMLHDWGELAAVPTRALGRIGDPVALIPLCRLLGNTRLPDAEPRWEAAMALGRLGDPAALPSLCQALGDADSRVREAAAYSLGQIGDPRAAPALGRLLFDAVPLVATRAAAALGAIGGEEAVKLLAAALTSRELRVRREGAVGLGKSGTPAAIAPLCRALHDPDSTVRRAAACSLGDLAMRHESPPLEIRAAVPVLKQLCAPLSREPSECKNAYREALTRIEIRTDRLKGLPLPAEAATPSTATLPRVHDGSAGHGEG